MPRCLRAYLWAIAEAFLVFLFHELVEGLTLGTRFFRGVTVILDFRDHRDDANGMRVEPKRCHESMELEEEEALPCMSRGKRRGMRPSVLCKLVAPMMKSCGCRGFLR